MVNIYILPSLRSWFAQFSPRTPSWRSSTAKAVRQGSTPKEPAPLSNALDPNLMTPSERLAEIGEILAAGLLRLRAKRAEESENHGDLSLDFPAHQSVHGRNTKTRERP